MIKQVGSQHVPTDEQSKGRGGTCLGYALQRGGGKRSQIAQNVPQERKKPVSTVLSIPN